MADNVISFPRSKDSREISVADAIRVCINYAASEGVIDPDGEKQLLHAIGSAEELLKALDRYDQ